MEGEVGIEPTYIDVKIFIDTQSGAVPLVRFLLRNKIQPLTCLFPVKESLTVFHEKQYYLPLINTGKLPSPSKD
jgi:hypothetical protein